MEKKIKSVKLKNDFRTAHIFIKAGTHFECQNEKMYRWNLDYVGRYCDYEVINNKNDFFDIEYEPETKFIDVRIEYNENEYGMSAEAICKAIINFDTRNDYVIKVTELPNEKGI
jgi:hypothetical protein